MAIPAAALYILKAIRTIETGSEGPKAYETIFGHNQDKLPEPLTRMTLAEVIIAGPSWTRRFKSSAAGAYQFMNATLKGLATEHDLKAEQIFDADFQDWLGYQLLRRRGIDKFLNGSTNIVAFGKALAQEWASFPVLADTKGAHRNVTRGETYYAGDKLNKSLVSPERIEKLLSEALAIHWSAPATPPAKDPPPPAPEPEEKWSFWGWIRSLFS